MSVLGIVLIWVWSAAAVAILGSWPAGKEGDRRTAYWAKFED